MSERRISSLPNHTGVSGSLAPRGEITDNVYESPGVDILSELSSERIRDEREDYEADVQDDVQAETPTNHVREINIKPLDSGYLVKVGCQSVAVETTEILLKALGEYLDNPTESERKWNKNKNRNKL